MPVVGQLHTRWKSSGCHGNSAADIISYENLLVIGGSIGDISSLCNVCSDLSKGE